MSNELLLLPPDAPAAKPPSIQPSTATTTTLAQPPTEPPPYPHSAKTSSLRSSSACRAYRPSSAPRSLAARGSVPSAPHAPSATSSTPSTWRPSSGSSSMLTKAMSACSPRSAAQIPASIRTLHWQISAIFPFHFSYYWSEDVRMRNCMIVDTATM
ncbi:hypothetical protein ACQJBY_058019 [Aegilops geniculata]